MKKQHQSGFTLVELAIVLVIIGLIVGGVLVGQDLIKAAEMRAQVSQIEKLNAAVNTFRNRFNGVPGDLRFQIAASYGMQTRTGAVGHGDGNGQLEACSAAAIVFGCETALFWRDLSFAELVEGTFNSATDALTAVASGNQDRFFLQSKVGRGNYLTVFTFQGSNYYQLTGITSTDAAGVYTLTEALTPAEADQIDVKMDDGVHFTGVVRALEGTGPLNTAAVAVTAAAGVCADRGADTTANTADDRYNTTTRDFATSPSCQLRFRFN